MVRAIENASDGDTVQLATDEYDLAGAKISVTANNLTIQGPSTVGDPSTFIPYLMFGTDNFGVTGGNRLVFFGSDPVVRNLAVTGEGSNALVGTGFTDPRVTLDRVVVNSTDPSGGIAFEGDNATITNSVIRNDGGSSFGRALEATGSITGSLVYASNGRAISLDGAYHDPGSCSLTVRNTIAWGGNRNLWLEGASPCSPVTINYDYSWIPLSASAQTGGGLTIVGASVMNPGSRNLPETPTAVDPTNPGATIVPSNSPAIDAGCTAGCGTHDYYGRPRPLGSANDIGPYEATRIPDVLDSSISNVTSTTALASTVIRPNGGDTTYNFLIRRAGESEWAAFSGARIPAGSNTPVSVSGEANQLRPGTDYQVRVVAGNEAGDVTTDGLAFRTLAAPPTPTPPRATISVSSLKAKLSRRSAYLTSRAKANGAGAVTQTATTGSGRKKRTWCTTTLRIAGAGTYSLRCSLGSKGRSYLRRKSLKLSVTTRFVADSGTNASTTRRLTVKRKR